MMKARRALPWAVILLLAACGEKVAEISAPPPPPPPSTAMALVGITPDGVELAVGGMLQMNAVTNFTNSGFTWSVSDGSLASISAIGMVTAKKAGTVGVRGCSKDHPSICGGATLLLVQPL